METATKGTIIVKAPTIGRPVSLAVVLPVALSSRIENPRKVAIAKAVGRAAIAATRWSDKLKFSNPPVGAKRPTCHVMANELASSGTATAESLNCQAISF
jgi:hypothetical protein